MTARKSACLFGILEYHQDDETAGCAFWNETHWAQKVLQFSIAFPLPQGSSAVLISASSVGFF